MPRFSLENAIPVLLFLGVGFMCMTFGVLQMNRKREQQRWPQKDALILSSEARLEVTDQNPEVMLSVQYVLQGVSYTTLVYATDIRQAEFVPPRYASGQQVTIRYDPADPSSAIRHRPSLVSSTVVIVFGLVPVAPAMLIVAYWLAIGCAELNMLRARYWLREAEQEPSRSKHHFVETAADHVGEMLDDLQGEIDAIAPGKGRNR